MLWSGCLVVLVTIASVPSAPNAGVPRIGGDPARDVRQTIEARKRLADDPELAAWNIGVTVRDRTATLWGPVPSVEVSFRAELCLKTMIELTGVRNETFVSELLKPMRVPLKIDNPPSPGPDALPPPAPGSPRLQQPIPGGSPMHSDRGLARVGADR
jgi:hypothetical protein